MPQELFEIEFIGGPFDGHKVSCSTYPAHLSADVIWFVCEDAFRQFDGRDNRPSGPITSVALYELEAENGAARYRFVGAISVEELTHSMRET